MGGKYVYFFLLFIFPMISAVVCSSRSSNHICGTRSWLCRWSRTPWRAPTFKGCPSRAFQPLLCLHPVFSDYNHSFIVDICCWYAPYPFPKLGYSCLWLHGPFSAFIASTFFERAWRISSPSSTGIQFLQPHALVACSAWALPKTVQACAWCARYTRYVLFDSWCLLNADETLIVFILGSAVAVERLFLGGRDTIALRRASLHPDTIRILMILKQHIRVRESQKRQ